jgi:hypothetical protein
LRKARIHFKQVPLSVVKKILKSQAKQKKTASQALEAGEVRSDLPSAR